MPDGYTGTFINRVSLAEARACASLPGMLLAHYEELCQFKDLAGVSAAVTPNWAMYEAAERQGSLIIVLAYDRENCIGYSANVLLDNMHYPGLKFAQNDVLFVDPAHRLGRIGLRLIRETRLQAKMAGAVLMLWRTKPGSALEKLLPRLGCEVLDTVWSERI